MIYHVIDHYNDDEDRLHVQEFVIDEGEPPEGFPRFKAVGTISIRLHNYDVPRKYFANIEADSLAEAFEKARAALERVEPAAREHFEQEIGSHKT